MMLIDVNDLFAHGLNWARPDDKAALIRTLSSLAFYALKVNEGKMAETLAKHATDDECEKALGESRPPLANTDDGADVIQFNERLIDALALAYGPREAATFATLLANGYAEAPHYDAATLAMYLANGYAESPHYDAATLDELCRIADRARAEATNDDAQNGLHTAKSESLYRDGTVNY